MPAVATTARPEPSPAYVWGTHRAGPPKARVASFGSKRGLADGRGAAVGSGRQSESIGLQQQHPSSTDWKQGAQMSDLAVPLPPPPLPSSARRARSCTRSEANARVPRECGHARPRRDSQRRRQPAKPWSGGLYKRQGGSGGGAWLWSVSMQSLPLPPATYTKSPPLNQRERHEGEAGQILGCAPFHY